MFIFSRKTKKNAGAPRDRPQNESAAKTPPKMAKKQGKNQWAQKQGPQTEIARKNRRGNEIARRNRRGNEIARARDPAEV